MQLRWPRVSVLTEIMIFTSCMILRDKTLNYAIHSVLRTVQRQKTLLHSLESSNLCGIKKFKQNLDYLSCDKNEIN